MLGNFPWMALKLPLFLGSCHHIKKLRSGYWMRRNSVERKRGLVRAKPSNHSAESADEWSHLRGPAWVELLAECTRNDPKQQHVGTTPSKPASPHSLEKSLLLLSVAKFLVVFFFFFNVVIGPWNMEGKVCKKKKQKIKINTYINASCLVLGEGLH